MSVNIGISSLFILLLKRMCQCNIVIFVLLYRTENREGIIHLRIRRVIFYVSNTVDSTVIVQNFISTVLLLEAYIVMKGGRSFKPF